MSCCDFGALAFGSFSISASSMETVFTQVGSPSATRNPSTSLRAGSGAPGNLPIICFRGANLG